jgi:hypothetical protein
MNERIKELALECYNPYSNFDHEKFALLIIQECANAVEHRREISKPSPGEYGNGFVSGISAAAKYIPLHFGIEQ